MENKTVILTTLNEAWSEPGSIFDLFLESFKIGDNTQKLLNHLVIITLDHKAHARCLSIHPHCFALKSHGLNLSSEAFFMTSNYLEMLWARIHFLSTILHMGYNFIFTVSILSFLNTKIYYLVFIEWKNSLVCLSNLKNTLTYL